MRTLVAAALCCVVLVLAACRSTDHELAESDLQASEDTPTSTTERLDPELSRDLYYAMLNAEINAGIKVSRDRLRSSSGYIQCHRDGALKSCFLRVRLMNDELSEKLALTESLNEIFLDKVSDADGFQNHKISLLETYCSFVGKRSPPYNVRQIDCRADRPHPPNETSFTDHLARALIEALRNGQSLDGKHQVLKGMIDCQWVGEKKRSICTVRDLGENATDIIEVEATAAKPIADRILRYARDAQQIHPEKNRMLDLPTQVDGALFCDSDLTDVDEPRLRCDVTW